MSINVEARCDARLFSEEIRRNINLQTAEIDMIKERYNIVVNISNCYKFIQIALDTVLRLKPFSLVSYGTMRLSLNDQTKVSPLRFVLLTSMVYNSLFVSTFVVRNFGRLSRNVTDE